MKKVVVVGAAVIDVLLKSDGLKVVKGHEVPSGVAICEVVGGKLEAEESMISSGGGGTNVAVGLRRLGMAVKMISRIGADHLGDVMIKLLDKEGLDLSMLQKGSLKTGLSVVLVAPGGARSIVTYRGESEMINPKMVDWDEIKKADWVQISSLGGEIGLLEDFVSFAVTNGIKVGINPGRKELEKKERLLKLIPKVDFFNVNKKEASALLGEEFESEDKIIKKFLDIGVRVLAITDGKNGASLVINRRWLKMKALQLSGVDDTGAGDAFVCGVVAGILQYKNPEEILKMGLVNGGSQVTKLGAKDGLLYKNEMEKWMKKKVEMIEEII